MADNKNNRKGSGNYRENTGRSKSGESVNRSGKNAGRRSPYAAYTGKDGTYKKPSGKTGGSSHAGRTDSNNEQFKKESTAADNVRRTASQNARHTVRKKPENPKVKIAKKIAAVLGTTLLSIFLVVVITGTIVATAMTVYVLEFMDESTDVTIKELENSANTIVYAQDGDKLVQLYAVTSEVQRIPVDIEQIPQHVRDAFVCVEDERFYSHEGVDYKRTFAAFANMFMHIYDTKQGGSTITQQLIKNLTGDDDPSPKPI